MPWTESCPSPATPKASAPCSSTTPNSAPPSARSCPSGRISGNRLSARSCPSMLLMTAPPRVSVTSSRSNSPDEVRRSPHANRATPAMRPRTSEMGTDSSTGARSAGCRMPGVNATGSRRRSRRPAPDAVSCRPWSVAAMAPAAPLTDPSNSTAPSRVMTERPATDSGANQAGVRGDRTVTPSRRRRSGSVPSDQATAVMSMPTKTRPGSDSARLASATATSALRPSAPGATVTVASGSAKSTRIASGISAPRTSAPGSMRIAAATDTSSGLPGGTASNGWPGSADMHPERPSTPVLVGRNSTLRMARAMQP